MHAYPTLHLSTDSLMRATTVANAAAADAQRVALAALTTADACADNGDPRTHDLDRTAIHLDHIAVARAFQARALRHAVLQAAGLAPTGL